MPLFAAIVLPAVPKTVELRIRPACGALIRFVTESRSPDNGRGSIRLGETIMLTAVPAQGAGTKRIVEFHLVTSEGWALLPPAMAERTGAAALSRRPGGSDERGRFDTRWRYLPRPGETVATDSINGPMFVTFEFPAAPVHVGSRWSGRYGRPFGLPMRMRVAGFHPLGDDTAVSVGFEDAATPNNPFPILPSSRYVVSARDGLPLLFEIRDTIPGRPPRGALFLRRLGVPGIEALARKMGLEFFQPPPTEK